jgi:hypothetical protein
MNMLSDNVSCIPVPPPDEECNTRIQKLVGYVCRNGMDFEKMVRAKEGENPKFDFLRDGEGADYYKWALLCGKMHYSKETIERIESKHRERLVATPPGFLALTAEDGMALNGLLDNNTGTKESVKTIRKWILKRAHSMGAIAVCIHDFINGITMATTPEAMFTKILHAVYIINDIFFNPSLATAKGPYTKLMGDDWEAPFVDVVHCFSPYLPAILHFAYISSPDTAGREKLKKIVDLWVTKKILLPDTGDSLQTAMCAPSAPVAANTPPLLHSPYAVNLPPPIMPPVPPPPPTQAQPLAPPFFHGAHLPPGMPPGMYNMPPGMPPGMPNMYGPAPMQGPMSLSMPGGGYGFPSHPAPPPQPSAPIDLHNCSVGVMANIVRNAIKLGHAKYTPLNAATVTHSVAPHVEPGRLEARVIEYYRKASSGKGSGGQRIGDGEEELERGRGYGGGGEGGDSRERPRARRSRSRSRDRDRDRDRNRDRGRDGRMGGFDNDEAVGSGLGYGKSSSGNGGRRRGDSFSDNKSSGTTDYSSSSGGGGRGGIGWQQQDIIEHPVVMSHGEPDFASYRTMQSSDYHTRMAEREQHSKK